MTAYCQGSLRSVTMSGCRRDLLEELGIHTAHWSDPKRGGRYGLAIETQWSPLRFLLIL